MSQTRLRGRTRDGHCVLLRRVVVDVVIMVEGDVDLTVLVEVALEVCARPGSSMRGWCHRCALICHGAARRYDRELGQGKDDRVAIVTVCLWVLLRCRCKGWYITSIVKVDRGSRLGRRDSVVCGLRVERELSIDRVLACCTDQVNVVRVCGELHVAAHVPEWITRNVGVVEFTSHGQTSAEFMSDGPCADRECTVRIVCQ